MSKYIIPGVLLLIVWSCGKPLPTLDGLDEASWKSDKYGCLNQRSTFMISLITQKSKLKSLTEDDIIDLLGRPDQNELYTRNQKFYRYFLEPGASCENAIPNPKRLIIRFNAIGLAKEVSVE